MTDRQEGVPLGRRRIIQLIAVVIAGVLVSWFMGSQAPVGQNIGGFGIAREVLRDDGSPLLEARGANLTIVTFTDYQCPACRRAHPQMLAAVQEDGRVRLIYRDWPIFGVVSERAARLALASDYQGIYPAVHDALMRAGSLDDAVVRVAVEQAGGDWARLLADLARHRVAIDAHLARNAAQAQALGLEGTPGYLVGPVLIRGGIDEGAFRRAFAQARAEGRP